MNLQYAISLWNFSHYVRVGSLEQELARIRELGYGVELWGRWRDAGDLYAPDRRPALKAALAGMPVSLHSAIVHSLAAHQAQVDAARDLGADVLVVHSDEFYLPGRRDLDVALCRDVVAYAADRGVRIALENGQLPFLEGALAAVEGLKICLDLGHVYLTATPLPDFLTTLAPHLVHLHLQDILSPAESGVPHAGPDHYALGTGGIPADDWARFVATLREIEFEGMAVLEIQPRNPYQTAALGVRFFDGVLGEEGIPPRTGPRP